MARDYRAEYEQRNAIAREQGFDSYSQKRHALESFADRPGLQSKWGYFQDNGGYADDPADSIEDFRVFWGAFGDRKTSDDYGDDSFIHDWFVDVVETMDDKEFHDRYKHE